MRSSVAAPHLHCALRVGASRAHMCCWWCTSLQDCVLFVAVMGPVCSLGGMNGGWLKRVQPTACPACLPACLQAQAALHDLLPRGGGGPGGRGIGGGVAVDYAGAIDVLEVLQGVLDDESLLGLECFK